jgi:hypothetical protein
MKEVHRGVEMKPLSVDFLVRCVQMVQIDVCDCQSLHPVSHSGKTDDGITGEI